MKVKETFIYVLLPFFLRNNSIILIHVVRPMHIVNFGVEQR